MPGKVSEAFEDVSAISEAERNLRELNIDYRRQADGTLVVPGDIDFSYKELEKLPNLSGVVVEGHFFCYNARLTSLEGAPAFVGGRCGVSNNRLTSLKGSPRSVGEGFYCTGNLLTSLEGAPADVADSFACTDNRTLASLEHAPRSFKRIQSDFGEFASWNDVPDHLASVTKAQYLHEIGETIAREATILQAPVTVTAPLRFKKF